MKKTAAVALCRCHDSHSMLGMRYEKTDRGWIRTWAFPIKANTAKNEHYDMVKMTGALETSTEYPGCPYCGTRSFFQCGNCGKLNCWNGRQERVHCEWCGADVIISGGNVTEIQSSNNM